MSKIWIIIYNIFFVPFFKLFFWIAPLFNQKIKIGVADREKLFENLILNLTGMDRKKKMIWFHSSSMGEFEQAKPIIEQLKKKYNINVLVTFFSPSGYRNSLKYPYLDVISYLPIDTKTNAQRILNLVRPDLVIFMRYDFWPNLLWELDEREVPHFIVDATMKESSKRKLPVLLDFHKFLFKGFTKILTVSDIDKKNFLDFEIKKEVVCSVGDTRFDRVYQKSLAAKNKKLFKDGMFAGKQIFVVGSSWESDEEVVLPAILKLLQNDPSVIVFIVPHEPTIMHLERLEHSLINEVTSIRFSFLNNYQNEKVIIIDSIGILLTLYSYADAAYVGGSFKQGIHNVLEPAVYGIPVIFGSKIENSQEALKLVELKGAKVINNKKECYRVIRLIFSDKEVKEKMGTICKNYVLENIGATDKIISEINKYI
ncbi:MAG: 3-deoxy-D-manno-octulosonic acid transferase [Melioribacteraceae bacterium]|nr:3-deoxy-D-manno-octulosonic acid transferase [Melioribacteraceae bacterium]